MGYGHDFSPKRFSSFPMAISKAKRVTRLFLEADIQVFRGNVE